MAAGCHVTEDTQEQKRLAEKNCAALIADNTSHSLEEQLAFRLQLSDQWPNSADHVFPLLLNRKLSAVTHKNITTKSVLLNLLSASLGKLGMKRTSTGEGRVQSSLLALVHEPMNPAEADGHVLKSGQQASPAHIEPPLHITESPTSQGGNGAGGGAGGADGSKQSEVLADGQPLNPGLAEGHVEVSTQHELPAHRPPLEHDVVSPI